MFYSKHKQDPGIFRKDDWRGEAGFEQRLITMDRLYTEYQKNEWRSEKKIPVLSMLHGTTEEVAWKICLNGFGIVAKVDAGYYGKGMYFTSSLSYATAYAEDSKQKYAKDKTAPNAFVVAAVAPGNPFPVIEHPKEKGSFLGQACQTGYQSHYVLGKLPFCFPLLLCQSSYQFAAF